MTGFIKAMRTEEADFLDDHPIANHVLNVIARRARRTPCTLNKLEVGECFIGHKGLGITERQYRTAKKQLSEWSLVEFKRGRKATDKGTVAKLLDSRVYDINATEGDGRETEERRKSDGKETTNKECKKDKNERINDLFDADRIIPVWNSLGCARHKGLTKSAAKALEKTYKEYCKSANEPKELNEWLESYLKKGFKNWMTDHHRDLDNGQWCADLEFAVRFSTYDKIKNTVKK